MDINLATRNRILELCENRGLNLNKLANMSGITRSTLENIASGRNQSTTISTIKRICDGLSITIIQFFSCPLFENLDEGIY